MFLVEVKFTMACFFLFSSLFQIFIIPFFFTLIPYYLLWLLLCCQFPHLGRIGNSSCHDIWRGSENGYCEMLIVLHQFILSSYRELAFMRLLGYHGWFHIWQIAGFWIDIDSYVLISLIFLKYIKFVMNSILWWLNVYKYYVLNQHPPLYLISCHHNLVIELWFEVPMMILNRIKVVIVNDTLFDNQ